MLRKKVHTNFKLYLCRTFCGFVSFNKNIKTYRHEIKIIICHDKVNLRETNDFNPNLGGGGGGLILPTC